MVDKNKKIKVLVVEDSLVFREAMVRKLSSDPQIEVAAVATNPIEARNRIIQIRPDVITCDIEMPIMNGIEFVRDLLPKYFVPMIMVSSISDKVFEAMEAGAVDFVVKPDTNSSGSIEDFYRNLIHKIKTAASIKTPLLKPEKPLNKITESVLCDSNIIIAIGASTGGTEAISNILSALPTTVPGIVIVQHIPPVFSRMFAERLNNQSKLHIKEAETGDYVKPGTVLIAPGDKHMKINKVGTSYRVECFSGDKVNGHCPSVDVLFESVAKEVGNNGVGILLTGMGYDGARGLLAMRRKGGRTIGQDKESSVVYGMPKVAFDIGAVEKQVSLGNIPQVLFNML